MQLNWTEANTHRNTNRVACLNKSVGWWNKDAPATFCVYWLSIVAVSVFPLNIPDKQCAHERGDDLVKDFFFSRKLFLTVSKIQNSCCFLFPAARRNISLLLILYNSSNFRCLSYIFTSTALLPEDSQWIPTQAQIHWYSDAVLNKILLNFLGRQTPPSKILQFRWRNIVFRLR